MSDNPTPPEPITDWPAWSADMHARLHPTPGDVEQVRAHFNAAGTFVRYDHAEMRVVFDELAEVERIADNLYEIHVKNVAAWRELWPDVDGNFHFPIDRARAERDALRERLALDEHERAIVFECRAKHTDADGFWNGDLMVGALLDILESHGLRAGGGGR